MNLKKAFQAFNEALKDDGGTEQVFGEAVLSDGTIIKWEGDLVEGVAVTKVLEDGSEVSLEDGSHVLEDGRTLEVRGGLVAAMAAIEEDMNEAFDADKFKQEISEMIDAKLAEFKEGFATVASVEEMGSKLAEQVSVMAEQVMAAFEKGQEPKPTKPIKNEADDRMAKAIQMAAALRKSNN